MTMATLQRSNHNYTSHHQLHRSQHLLVPLQEHFVNIICGLATTSICIYDLIMNGILLF